MFLRLTLSLGSGLQRAVFLTTFLFGLLAWLCVVAIQVSNPKYLSMALTHIDMFPLNLRVDLAYLALRPGQ